MKTFTTCFIALCFQMAAAQNRTVNIDDPLSDIDLAYTPVDGITRISVILNTIDADLASTQTNEHSAEVTIQGSISWRNQQSDPNKYILKETRLTKIGNDKPFVLFADLYDGSNAFIKKPSAQNNWEKISIRLVYNINGKFGQTPKISLYPPEDETRSVGVSLEVATQAIQKDSRSGIISLKSVPAGTPIEVTEFKIVKKTGANESTTVASREQLTLARFAYNGETQLPFNTAFDIEALGNKYFVSCKANTIGGTPQQLQISNAEIVFIPDPDIRIINRPPSYTIQLSNGNQYIDENIETSGNGKLGIRFLNAQYQIIRPTVSLANGKYNIKLEGLSEIPSETSSTYYYTNAAQNIDISAPLVISKNLPKVTNFSFNGVNGDSVKMTFRLPGIDSGTDPTIFLTGDQGVIRVGGSVVVRRKESDKFEVNINRGISGLIAQDKIVRDISINVEYSGHVLYTFTVTVFNQRLHDEKISQLKDESEKKPKDRDKVKIQALVKSIVDIGKAVGKSVTDSEVSDAIDNLENAKGEKVKSVMSDIGRWALVVGKVILPIL